MEKEKELEIQYKIEKEMRPFQFKNGRLHQNNFNSTTSTQTRNFPCHCFFDKIAEPTAGVDLIKTVGHVTQLE